MKDFALLNQANVEMESVNRTLIVYQDNVVRFGDIVEVTPISVQRLPPFHPQLLRTIMSVTP